MIKFDEGQLTDILPSQMRRDVETQCISYALKQQMKHIVQLSNQTRTVAMIDELPEKILDILAVELRTPYYRESMDIESKRTIIKKTLVWHTKAGTPSAVAELIEIIFGEGKVVEWFDYEEAPYTPGTFDIITNARMTEDVAEEFLAIIQRVKNTRSHIRRILIERKLNMDERVGTGAIGSPKEAILNHKSGTAAPAMTETAASAIIASPSETITNAAEKSAQIASDERAGSGARAEPHINIGNNVAARQTQAEGVVNIAAGAIAAAKVVILNGNQTAARSIKQKQLAAAAGTTAHSTITI